MENAIFLFVMFALGCALLTISACIVVSTYIDWRDR